MNQPKKSKQTRELDSKRIAESALGILDSKGVAGFSMRAVANDLGVTPMALYHHVKDKAGLVALVVDATMLQTALPTATGQWRNDLWSMACWMREISLKHPAVSRLRREFHIWTPSMLQMSERWFSLWQQSGLDFDSAILAATSSSKAIAGIVAEEINLQQIPLPDETSLNLLPNLRAIYKRPSDRNAEFEFTVKALLDGIFRQLTDGAN